MAYVNRWRNEFDSILSNANYQTNSTLNMKSEMKTIEEIEKLITYNKKEFYEKYGLITIGIFGSYSRGEQNTDSDLDLLVEVQRPMGFVKFMRLENHLSQLLGVKVDMVTKKALKPHIGKRILQEVQYV